MLAEIQTLLNDYLAWLRDKTVLRQVEDWVEITTPYLDRHNDYMQIYARTENGGYLLTDDGNTLRELEMAGCRLDTAKRQALLNTTLNGFGVKLQNGELEVRASADSFALRKHNLVQAMLAVGDLFYLAKPMIASLFHEDVEDWLDACDIRFTPKPKFTGRTGFDHTFDYVIPKSKLQPERILQLINNPTRDFASAVAFAWIDIKEVRPADARAYALINDTERTVQSGVLEALRNYDVRPVLWAKRAEVQDELAA
jgi:hypothetical protein